MDAEGGKETGLKDPGVGVNEDDDPVWLGDGYWMDGEDVDILGPMD
jgi:hypothetical protein